jgi:flotillin
MTGYRDDLQAAQVRIDTLERELASARDAGLARSTDAGSRRTRAGRLATIGAAGLLALGAITVALGWLSGALVLALVTAALTVSLALTLVLVARCVVVAAPNELLLIVGRATRDADGVSRGYRVVREGRAVVLPLIERVERVDVSALALSGSLVGIYAREARPVNVRWTATVALSASPAHAHRAIERFLGLSRDEVSQVARGAIEGAIRGVVVGLSPVELRDEPLRAAERVRDELEIDLQRIGIEVLVVHLEADASD